jgi:hypothetical protein
MMLSLILAALISSGKLPPAQPIAQPDFDPANVLAPIRQLFSAFAAGDGQAVRRPACAARAAGFASRAGANLRKA